MRSASTVRVASSCADAVVTGNRRDAVGGRAPSSLGLVTHRGDRLGRRPDPAEAGRGHLARQTPGSRRGTRNPDGPHRPRRAPRPRGSPRRPGSPELRAPRPFRPAGGRPARGCRSPACPAGARSARPAPRSHRGSRSAGSGSVRQRPPSPRRALRDGRERRTRHAHSRTDARRGKPAVGDPALDGPNGHAELLGHLPRRQVIGHVAIVAGDLPSRIRGGRSQGSRGRACADIAGSEVRSRTVRTG